MNHVMAAIVRDAAFHYKMIGMKVMSSNWVDMKNKCVVCGCEWSHNEWQKGTMYVEPGKPRTSRSGVHVCNDCIPLVKTFHNRINDNQRELRHIMEEWYTVKKFDR